MNDIGASPSVSRPIMFQAWRSLTFLHWRSPPRLLESFLPSELQLDLFDGDAWLGLTPFLLRDLRAPGLPLRLNFPETNVRTYVRGPGGEPGVWFFGLDAGSLAAVVGARAGFGLPYFWSAMQVSRRPQAVEYWSDRRWSGQEARVHALIEPGQRQEPTELTTFLTERYRLYTRLFGRLAWAEVEHAPWPLQRARALELEQSLTSAAGLPAPLGEPLVHYSEGVEVRIGRPRLRFVNASTRNEHTRSRNP